MMGCMPMNSFTFDLTDEQKRLCAWVAEQARIGVDRVWYTDVKAAMNVADDRRITRILRQIRERLDSIHAMIHSPIVNTNDPYFDLHRDADCIWDDYCRAEMEELGVDFDSLDTSDMGWICHPKHEHLTCAV